MFGKRLLWATGRGLSWIFFILFFHVRIFGQNRVPRKGGVLIVSNHQSYFDPVLIGLGVGRIISFMARRSLFRHALFGALIRALNAFPISRGGADVAAIREAVERLQSGWALTVFPEGTRTVNGIVGKMQPGALALAERAEVPILPAAITGAFEAWPRDGGIRRTQIAVAYGNPILPAEYKMLSREALAERLRNEIIALQQELRLRLSPDN